MDGLKDGRTDIQTDGLTDGLAYLRADRLSDGLTDRRAYSRSYGQAGLKTDGLTDRWAYRQTDTPSYRDARPHPIRQNYDRQTYLWADADAFVAEFFLHLS